MGIVFIEGKVRGPQCKEKEVNFLIDSGATYSLLPLEVWKSIEITPKKNMTFTFADGKQVNRFVSECYIILPQGEGHTPVILGEEDDKALIGIVTLEILGLVLNPFKRTLEPMKMLLI